MKDKKLRIHHIIDALRPGFYTIVKAFLSMILVVFIQSTAFGQQIDVSGTVTGEDGNSIPGVSILVQGTSTGTTTNIDGEYSLTAPSDGTLIFSYIGYIRQEVAINGRNTIDIVLQESIALLDELIVTGYSTQRRADITGAVASIDIESASRVTSASVLQRLDGRVSGVTVDAGGSPGSRSTVRIRGISSFGNNEPLYIVDGTPVQDSFMNFLSPNDIESIQVLKDASSASIYGSRANNGVIIIETKKGTEGAPQVEVNIRTGMATPVNSYDSFLFTDALEYHQILKAVHENAGLAVPTNTYGNPNSPAIPNYIWPNDGRNPTNSLAPFGLTEDDYVWGQASQQQNQIMPGSAGTNWWDAVFGTGYTQDYNVAVSGGGANNRYNVSFNYFDQEGTAAYNRFQRGTIRVNTDFSLGNLTIGENIALTLEESYGGLGGDYLGEGNIMGKNILQQPIVPIYDIGGNFASGKAPGLGNMSNPLKIAYNNRDDKGKYTRVFGNTFVRYNVMEKVVVQSRLGFNLSFGNGTNFNARFPEDSEPSFSESISEFQNNSREWTWSNTATYMDTFGERHNVNVLVGQEAIESQYRGINGSLGQLVTTDINARYIQDAIGNPDTKNVSSGGSIGSLLSFFGKVDYNYDQRYNLSATVRRDGSSRLGPNNRWGTFPALSAGWRISNESFMQDNDFFSNIMIRAGYGVTGNQSIPGGRAFDLFGGGTGDTFYAIGGGNGIVTGYRQDALGNPDLKWEENTSVNAGLDLEFFEGRFNFVLDVYERTTDNLLFAPGLPATAGRANAPIVNIGKMQNTGFDFTIGYRGNISRDLNLSISFNGSHYKNEILRIDGEQDSFQGPISSRFGNAVINEVGKPIGSFRGLKTDGIFANQAEVDAHVTQAGAKPGRFRFVDVNGDGEITLEDRTIIGDPHPDFIGGLDLELQYKNWDFNANIFGTFGNDIFDVQKEFYVFRNFNTNVRTDLLTKSAIVENGQVTNIGSAIYPRLDISDTFSNEQSSFFVEDGSYVRLRSLQVGYSFPPDVVPGMRNLRLFVQAENLFTITGYSGLDPALPALGASSGGIDVRDQARGMDRGSYPSNKTLTFGVSAVFN
ncbi:MAG: TonB-dependent receptor [Balneolaceae bacterium]